MSLSRFIIENMEAIVTEWEAFATTMEPAASTMSALALRDHAKPILLAIAKDLESSQTAVAQSEKSKGLAPSLSTRETAAATHGALRHVSGFDLNQLGAEYRALRASVIRLWTTSQHSQLDSAMLDDMIRFNEALDQAVAESTSRYAAELALSRDTFMAILAHDLRSPLNAITMLSYLLKNNATTDRARSQADQIQTSAKEMGAMIRDLLDYTRTQLGKGIPVHTQKCAIAPICRESVDEIRAAHPQRQFEIVMPQDTDWMVDNARLRQALSNLLNNAVQHGDPASPITLSADVVEGALSICVVNRGKPIPPESLQIIFDPLVQLSAKSAASPSEVFSNSLGLGLFIAREVATGHHGTLDVTSDAASGTVFILRIPAAPALTEAKESA